MKKTNERFTYIGEQRLMTEKRKENKLRSFQKAVRLKRIPSTRSTNLSTAHSTPPSFFLVQVIYLLHLPRDYHFLVWAG
jgi:hypothetical protein